MRHVVLGVTALALVITPIPRSFGGDHEEGAALATGQGRSREAEVCSVAVLERGLGAAGSLRVLVATSNGDLYVRDLLRAERPRWVGNVWTAEKIIR